MPLTHVVQPDGPDRGPGSDGGGDDDDESRPMAPDLAVSGDLIDSSITMSHVAKFIEFVEKHIEPLWRRAAGTSQRKFRFIDLGMVFQPGELLYVPPPSDSLQSLEAATTKRSDSKMYHCCTVVVYGEVGWATASSALHFRLGSD